MNDSAAASPWHFSVAPMMDWTGERNFSFPGNAFESGGYDL
jgi:hypothetical protein